MLGGGGGGGGLEVLLIEVTMIKKINKWGVRVWGVGEGSSEVTMLHIIWYMVAEVSLPSFKQPRWLLYYIIMLTW